MQESLAFQLSALSDKESGTVMPNNTLPAITVQIKGYAGEEVRSFSDWEKYALPSERRRHWKEGRSAFELGREWTMHGEPTVPIALTQLLDSLEATKNIHIHQGFIEHETKLPYSNYGARSHDLALQATKDGSNVAICIESKADESFGGTLIQEVRKATRRSQNSRFPERLDWLTRSLLGIAAFKDDKRLELAAEISELPYQLFSAIGGTLLEAHIQNASTAIFVVHEFRTTATEDSKLQANANALNDFLHLFLVGNDGQHNDLPLRSGQVIGPITIRERLVNDEVTIPCHIPLFIGKITTDRLR